MPDTIRYLGRAHPHGPGQTRGALRITSLKSKTDLARMNPDNNPGLGLARVVTIDYEGFLVTLRTISGASQMFQRVPVPLTFPGAGARHFFGSMPTVGDTCIIGWMHQSSSEGSNTKTPVILGWVVPGLWPGRDWVTTAEMPADEFDPGHGERKYWEGSFDRVRHKLRHLQPGNIVGSSAQGADLVLDEGVTLSNRRGNEFKLRDQDQAAILRALQQFTALAGARIYAGMVQRDATFLPTKVVSDGKLWDDGLQAAAGLPLPDSVLPPDPDAPRGYLTPSANLHRSRDGQDLTRSLLPVNPYLDPYQFLKRGGFLNEFGYVVDDKHQADAVYGGKPLFRVSSQGTSNAVTSPDMATLTEYRLEVTHTSDGRLPVTDQTDMFDAERLPGQDAGQSPNVPFIEWVLGSVVGNDPFSQDGRPKYGLPMVARVFDGSTPSPRLEAARLALVGGGANPTPMAEQAATLFRLTPPGGGDTTFVSYNKKGQLRASIGGDPEGIAAEVFLNGGLKLGILGGMQLFLAGETSFGTSGKATMSVGSEKGGVRIFGGGSMQGTESAQESLIGTDGGAGDSPAVDIEAATNMRLRAQKKVLVKGQHVEVNASQINLLGHDSISVDGVQRTSISTESFQLSVNGKSQESYGGPKYMLPTNFPLHERTYAPSLPGYVSEKVTYIAGDREETFRLGNHKTTVLVGNLQYETDQGTWSARAVGSHLKMGTSGIEGTAQTGTITLTANAGEASMTGVSVSLVATGGVATLKGTSGVYLGGPVVGPDSGPLICAGSLDPLTGLPFGTWGMGAKNHIVGS